MTTAAVLAAVTTWLAVRVPVRERLEGLRRDARNARDGVVAAPGLILRVRESGLLSSPVLAGGLGCFAVTRVITGPTGLLVAVGVGVGIHRWVSGLDSTEQRRRRDRLVQDLPLAVDLMVSAIEAGRPPAQVLTMVGDAVGGPLAEELGSVVARLELGSDPVGVWRSFAERPGLETLGRAFARASDTGAPLGVVLTRCVDDLRADRRAAAQERARSVGVRTAAPLGACFLPAFVVIGVVPTLIGAFSTLVI